MTVTKLVLVRHGESQWNKENRFTGWSDIDLSEKGISEAKTAGKLLKENGFAFDFAYTSMLRRAIHTLWSILDEIEQSWLPVEKTWKLNERHYGALQGLNKSEVIKRYGHDQVKQWRRSLTVIPPAITKNDTRYPGHDLRYIKLSTQELPLAENLLLTIKRVVPFWQNAILPRLRNHERIIIVAHGNSLRALMQHLDQINEADLLELNIPTGTVIIYEFNEYFKPITHYYLENKNIK